MLGTAGGNVLVSSRASRGPGSGKQSQGISGLSGPHPNPGAAASSKQPCTITKAHSRHSACAQKLKLAEPEGGGRVGSAGALEQADKPAFPLQGEDPGEKCLGVGTRLPQERHSQAEAKGPFNLQV